MSAKSLAGWLASYNDAMVANGLETAVREFARRFVVSRLRERVVYEAARKPERLHRRICHRIELFLEDGYEGGNCRYAEADECWLLGWGAGFERTTWGEAMREIAHRGGGGYLIVDASGAKFWVEEERSAKCTPRIFAGEKS